MAFYQQYKTLTMVDNFDINNVVFDKPRDEEVGGNKHIKGKRIKIGYMNSNGKISELIIPTEKLYAYKGVRPTKPFGKEDSDEIIGYNLPIALYSRDDNANGRDKKFVQIFRDIIDTAKNHVISVKKQIGQSHLEKVMLYKWDNMLYEKKNDETGEPANDFGPTLYSKLMYSRDRNTIATKLVDKHGRPLNLDEVLNKPCDAIACVKFESIYVNSNGCSLQVKITEAILDIKSSPGTDNLLLRTFLTPEEEDDEELTEDTFLVQDDKHVQQTVDNNDSDIHMSDSDEGEAADTNKLEDDALLVTDSAPTSSKRKPIKKISKK